MDDYGMEGCARGFEDSTGQEFVDFKSPSTTYQPPIYLD